MDVTKNAPSDSVGALHKSRSSAVSGRIWFVALLTHQKYTDACVNFLRNNPETSQWESYVPRKKVLHVYPNRTRRMVDQYFIPRMIFVSGMEERVAYEHVRHNPYIDFFLPERAMPRTTAGRLCLAQVPDRDLDRLRMAIDAIDTLEDIELTKETLTSDSMIEVKEGQLAGLYGSYVHDRDKHFLCFALGRLGNIKVRVNITSCTLHK